MDRLQDIFRAIDADGFKESTLFVIDEYINDILYGRKDFNGFTLSEHAGLCKGGAPLIGTSIVISYARRSFTASGHVEGLAYDLLTIDPITGEATRYRRL